MRPLEISSRENQGVTIVDCKGLIVSGVSETIVPDALRDLVAKNKKLAMNFRGIYAIDKVGIGQLAAGLMIVEGCGGKVVFFNLNQRIKDAVTNVPFDQAFRICNDEAEAVKSFAV
jgi:anti-anti-sigma regulatory factor